MGKHNFRVGGEDPVSFMGYFAGIATSHHKRMDLIINYLRSQGSPVQNAEGKRISKDKTLARKVNFPNFLHL